MSEKPPAELRAHEIARALVDWLWDEYEDEDPRVIMLALSETIAGFVGQIRPGMNESELDAFVDELEAIVRDQVARKRH